MKTTDETTDVCPLTRDDAEALAAALSTHTFGYSDEAQRAARAVRKILDFVERGRADELAGRGHAAER